MSYRIRYDEEDGTLEREGIVTPRGSRVVMHGDGLLALKIAGHHYVSGRSTMAGGYPYAPAEFVVVEEVYTDHERELYNEDASSVWLRDGDVDGWINVRERMRWPVRS